MLDNLLGPNANADDPDLTLRCDIIFPEGEVMTLGFVVMGSDEPRLRLSGNRGTLESVGVGGVLTIMGAMSPGGGVCGAACVSIGCGVFAVRGRSGEEFVDGSGDCLSGNIAPILDATLPRLLSGMFFSFTCNSAPPPSRLLLGLVARRPGRKASFNLLPGEGDRF